MAGVGNEVTGPGEAGRGGEPAGARDEAERAGLVDLASARLGGRVLLANDEFFAPKESLVKPEPPVFIEGKYTDRGKWMDGWETRRRREPGHDWCILRLGVPGVLHRVLVDTAHFRGNHPEACSVEGCEVAGDPGGEELAALDGWRELVPRSPLREDSGNEFAPRDARRCTHLRLNIYPDGGVARLRAYGEARPDWEALLAPGEPVDLAAAEHGGSVLACSDAFFGRPLNLIMPGRAADMGEGWETRRRRDPGHDWAMLRLGRRGRIRRVEVDTGHFKGNYPESCRVEGCDAPGLSLFDAPGDSAVWREVLPRTGLRPDDRHVFEEEVASAGPVTHVRFQIYPDGGVARLRLYGWPAEEGELPLEERGGEMASSAAGGEEGGPMSGGGPGIAAYLNRLPGKDARRALLRCCGSRRWAEGMEARRPFADDRALLEAADRVWWALEPEDWREAFAHHPRIGERAAEGRRVDPEAGDAAPEVSAETAAWSGEEQSGAAGAPEAVRRALAEENQAYEERFGHVFLICATGRTAEEMLAELRRRMGDDAGTELRTAAEEQRKITRLRLAKLAREASRS